MYTYHFFYHLLIFFPVISFICFQYFDLGVIYCIILLIKFVISIYVIVIIKNNYTFHFNCYIGFAIIQKSSKPFEWKVWIFFKENRKTFELFFILLSSESTFIFRVLGDFPPPPHTHLTHFVCFYVILIFAKVHSCS